MQVLGTYSRYGFTIEVIDDAGYSMDSTANGNVAAYSPEEVDPVDPRALPLVTLMALCEAAASEKASMLGLPVSAVALDYDPA